MGDLFQLLLDFLSGSERKGELSPERIRTRRIITFVFFAWAIIVFALYLLGFF